MNFFNFCMFISFLLIIIASVIKIDEKNKKKNKQNNNSSIQQQYMPYRRRNLLTKTEYNFYITLKNTFDTYKLNICPKVRLEDIAEVTDKTKLSKYRGYIKSRHVDFIICDYNLYPLFAIELDDYSHNTIKAQNIDEFKNKLFSTIGLPLYRIIVGSNYVYELEKILYTLNIRNIPNINNESNKNNDINNNITNIINKQNELIEKQNNIIETLQNTIKNLENSNKQ